MLDHLLNEEASRRQLSFRVIREIHVDSFIILYLKVKVAYVFKKLINGKLRIMRNS
jgi:hypothetical protein